MLLAPTLGFAPFKADFGAPSNWRVVAESWSVPARFVAPGVQRDRHLLTALAYCVLAAMIACFRYSLFASMRAVAVITRASGRDFWINASGVRGFDFPDPIGEDRAGIIARYAPVAKYRRIADARSPKGRRDNVGEGSSASC